MLRAWLAKLKRGQDDLGRQGEQAAERFLKRLGYKIVDRGVRFRRGELDLVAVDGRTVVFVEVKTRLSHDKGQPAEAVDADKQRQLTRAALLYLKRHNLLEYRARFDVITVTWPADGPPEIDHIQNAFEPTGEGQMFS